MTTHSRTPPPERRPVERGLDWAGEEEQARIARCQTDAAGSGNVRSACELRERARQRHVGEGAQRRALGALAVGEAGAVLALVQVRAEMAALGAAKEAVQPPGDGALGLVARE